MKQGAQVGAQAAQEGLGQIASGIKSAVAAGSNAASQFGGAINQLNTAVANGFKGALASLGGIFGGASAAAPSNTDGSVGSSADADTNGSVGASIQA